MAKGAYIGVSYTPLSPTFSDNTWDQIVYACRNNCVPDTWAVGNQKSMKIGSADYLIDIVGKNHDSFADGSGKAPLTFLMHGTLAEPYAMNDGSDSNNGGWTNSSMRTTHLPAILKTMPPEVQAGIKEVNKLTSAGSASSTINTTADKLFLLAESEILGYASSSFPGEGSQYAYFANGNSPEKFSPDGTRRSWWLRSPYASNRTHFVSAWMKNSFGASVASTLNYVAFAFCFGGTTCPPSSARKIKKGYIGIGDVARKIKKAYIGIGGVARPCWSGGELAYYGTITPLSIARDGVATASNGAYAFFAGGDLANSYSAVVDAYDKSLTRKTATALSSPVTDFAGASMGKYALFGGGKHYNQSKEWVVNYYDTSLTKKVTNNTLNEERSLLSATATEEFAWFAGGINSSGASSARSIVDGYNASLTHTAAYALSQSKFRIIAASIGGKAIFAGGTGSSNKSVATVDVFDTSLTRTTAATLYEARSCANSAATVVGKYLIVSGYSFNATCDVYDSSLTRSNNIALSEMKNCTAATTVNGFAIFGGGENMVIYDSVDAFDESLTRLSQTPLSAVRYNVVATTVGNYALFGGGRDGNGVLNTVDAYVVA